MNLQASKHLSAIVRRGTVAHQINGEAKEGSYLVWNFVQIRSGVDVLFIYYSPAERDEGHTVKIAAAAWDKYSRVR